MLRITTEPVTFGADATEYVGLLNTYSYICHRKKTYCILVPFYVKIKIIFGTVYRTLYRTAYLLWTRIRLDLALSCRIEFDVSHLERILHDNDHILIFTKEKKKQISSLTALKQSTIWIGWAGAGLDQVF